MLKGRLRGLVALALAVACIDAPRPALPTGPELPGPEPTDSTDHTPRLAALIVSNPAQSFPALNLELQGVASEAGVVYASLQPGTITNGERLVVRTRSTGDTVSVPLVSGGFDPVAIAAEAGDTLDIDVSVGGRDPVTYYAVVPARRPPVVVRTEPPPGRPDVPLNAVIIVVFSEPIDAATLTSVAVRLLLDGAPVAGTLAFVDSTHLTARFLPAASLTGATDYTLLVTQAVEDLSGDALALPLSVEFSTVGSASPIAAVYERQSPHGVPGTHSRYVIREDGSFELRYETVSDTVVYTGSFTQVDSLLTFRFDDTSLDQGEGSEGGRGFGRLFGDSHVGVSYSIGPILGGLEEGMYARSPDTVSTPHYPPQTGQLAFARPDGIYLVNLDGSGLVQLTAVPGDASPAWSSDGSRLAFSRRSGANSEVFTMNADGSNVLQRTRDSAYNGNPSWSPDGQRIAFSGVRAGVSGASMEVSVMAADDDGSTPINLTNQVAYDDFPAWSPDGTQIAFVSDWAFYDIARDVFLMAPDGSQRVQLTTWFGGSALEYHQPTWSPDGTRLAVVGCPWAFYFCSSSVIRVLNADGSGMAQLAVTSGFGRPTWSPDGQVIVFSAGDTIRWVRVDGSDGGLILTNGYHPAWRP